MPKSFWMRLNFHLIENEFSAIIKWNHFVNAFEFHFNFMRISFRMWEELKQDEFKSNSTKITFDCREIFLPVILFHRRRYSIEKNIYRLRTCLDCKSTLSTVPNINNDIAIIKCSSTLRATNSAKKPNTFRTFVWYFWCFSTALPYY